MQSQDSGATADAHGSRRGRKDEDDDDDPTRQERVAETPPEKASPYPIKRCHENEILQMIRQHRSPLLPPIRKSPLDDPQVPPDTPDVYGAAEAVEAQWEKFTVPARQLRRVCGGGSSGGAMGKIHRHMVKSDMTGGVSDGVAFVGVAGSSMGVSLCRGAHHSVPVRRNEGSIPSGCLGVLPVFRRESLERVAEEDDLDDESQDNVKTMVVSDLGEAVSGRCTSPTEPQSVKLVRPPTPVPLHLSADSSAAGCSRSEMHPDTDVTTTPPPPLQDSSSSVTPSDSSSSTSSEWSAILEKVKALEPTQPRNHLPSVGSCCCRICQSSNNPELLISPCRCKGSLAYVHLSCLERWLNQSGRTYCELCQFRFNAIQTPRYRLLQSMRIWYCHPRHRRQLLADSLIAIILTCVTMGLVSIIILGMRYFILEGAKLGISPQCTQFTVTFFLAVVTSGYIVTMYLLVKDEVSPWLQWWRTNVNVRVVLDANIMERQPLRAGTANCLLPTPRSQFNTLSRVWGQAQPQ